MSGIRNTSEAGEARIKRHEALRLTAYFDPIGIPTIGWGHTSKAGPPVITADHVRQGFTITRDEAEAIFSRDLDEVAEEAINRLVTVPLNQNQYDALSSWTFNLGGDSLARSTMLKVLNAGRFEDVPAQMKRWVYADGEVLNGLVKRRDEEAALFATPTREPLRPRPTPPIAVPVPSAALVGISTDVMLAEISRRVRVAAANLPT